MEKITASVLGLFAIVIVFVVLTDIQYESIKQTKIDTLDTYLQKRVSVHRGLTPAVETELQELMGNLQLNPSDFDFSASTMGLVEWGETVVISYSVEPTLVQRGLDFFGLPHIETQPRQYTVVVTGR